jgi:hypothetical protein
VYSCVVTDPILSEPKQFYPSNSTQYKILCPNPNDWRPATSYSTVLHSALCSLIELPFSVQYCICSCCCCCCCPANECLHSADDDTVPSSNTWYGAVIYNNTTLYSTVQYSICNRHSFIHSFICNRHFNTTYSYCTIVTASSSPLSVLHYHPVVLYLKSSRLEIIWIEYRSHCTVGVQFRSLLFLIRTADSEADRWPPDSISSHRTVPILISISVSVSIST